MALPRPTHTKRPTFERYPIPEREARFQSPVRFGWGVVRHVSSSANSEMARFDHGGLEVNVGSPGK